MAKKIKSKLTNLFSLKKGDVILYNTPYGKTSDIVEKVDDKKIYFVSKFAIPKQRNSEKYEILEINGKVIFRDGGSIYSDSEFEVYGRAFPVFRVSDSHSDQMIDIMNADRESKFAKTYGYDIADEFGDIEYTAKDDGDLISFVNKMEGSDDVYTVADAKKYLHSINFSVQEVNYEHLPAGRKGYKDGGSIALSSPFALPKGIVTEFKTVAVSKNITPNDINNFVSYCNEFYGKNGVYAKELNGGFSGKEIQIAVLKYLDELGKQPTWGDGDSLDREGVRKILQPSYKFEKGGSVQEERFVDFYQTQGGLKFKTEEEAKGFIKTTKPFVRKQLREGNFALVFNGKEYFIGEKKKFEKGGYMGESEKIYKMAEAMTNSEHQKKLGELNEKQKKGYESLVRLGDSPKLAIATILLQKENKWDDDTIRAYTMANGGSVGSLEKELKRLQRELNSPRLGTYIEGDNSEEAKALKQEREVKLARFNEVLQLMREKEDNPSDNNTFVNVLLNYGFTEARSSHGVRFFNNTNGYFAFVDMKGKNVEVFKEAKAGTNYSGFSVQSLIKFLDEKGFNKKFEDGGTVVYAKGDTVKENQLFKAVSEDGKIKIYEKGLPLYFADVNDVEAHPEWFNDKYLYSVSASELDEAFKELEEESRSDAMEYQKEFVGVLFKNGGGVGQGFLERVKKQEAALKKQAAALLGSKVQIVKNLNNHKGYKAGEILTVEGFDDSDYFNVKSKGGGREWYLPRTDLKFMNKAYGHGGEIDVAPDDSDYQYMKWLKEKKGKRKIMFGWF